MRRRSYPRCYMATMRDSLQRRLSISLATGLLALGLALTAPTAMAIEEPSYSLVEQDGDFSLRSYAAVIVAETDVDGALDRASSAGFRRLAGYIFGGNRAASSIAMTAPVTTYRHGDGWTVDFTMPSRSTLASLPLPDDGRVKLREVPVITVAVIRFSGWVDESKFAAETATLREWMTAHGLVADGVPRLARYNPPWTLPFLRRNEILIPCHHAPSPESTSR